jgi:anti-sigma factor RsiW
MDCPQARTLFECYVDLELDPVTSARLDEHLQGCDGCRRGLAPLASLRRVIREGAPYHTAPDRLVQRVRQRVGQEGQSISVGPRRSWTYWLRPAALVAMTALATWTIASLLIPPSRSDLLAAEVMASHARSVLTGHLASIESSERHTVKPWLSSKLDFSPAVADLASEGFPLLGARLDYVDRRPVAALVYGRRKHVLNLFVWPESVSERFPAPRTLSKQGYNVVHWSDGGMAYWVVSDLNVKELKQFAEQWARAK